MSDPKMESPIEETPARPSEKGRSLVPVVLGVGVVAILVGGGVLVYRAEAKTNKVALTAAPKPVSVVLARATTFRPARSYVGTLEPWLSANVGPQMVSAYVDTVLVRPGAEVKKGDVLATLDCRKESAASQAMASEARAVDAKKQALNAESARLQEMLAGKFVSPNEAEQKAAQSKAQGAELEATRARLMRTTLEVSDCVLRAPFDGEVATRTIDPGAFVRPGVSLVSVVDRGTVRFTADTPEGDFDVVAPGTPLKIHLVATGKEVTGNISRRAPSADAATRTVHFEVDLADSTRAIPVNTTGEARIEVGSPIPSVEVPLRAAQVRGKKATVFVVEGDVVRSKSFEVKGESGGSLFLATDLADGARIVTEGRALLVDGDKVTAKVEGEK